MAFRPPIWITERDVVAMMDMRGAIEALEAGLLEESRGAAQNMVKTHATWGHGHTLHAIGATFAKAGFVGTKTWAHTEGGATPLLILFDAENGSLRAIVEAFAMGQLRTAAASGVATQRLASPGADELAIIGTGKQSLPQVGAILAVRNIRHIRVIGRDPAKSQAFVERLRQEFDNIEVTQFKTDDNGALNSVPIVTVITRAQQPIIFADMLSRGTHINALGAITPERAEVGQDILSRCTCITADSVPQAQTLSRELIEYFGTPANSAWKQVLPLSQVVASHRSRAQNDDLTLFKSLGMGISDLSLGIELYRKAIALKRGREIDAPEKALPRLKAS